MEGSTGSSPAAAATADPSAELLRLQQENDELRAQAGQPAQAPAPRPESELAPVEAIKAAIEANPEGTFMDHLKVLRDDGIKAVLDPSFEKDAIRVMAALLSDVIGKVK